MKTKKLLKNMLIFVLFSGIIMFTTTKYLNINNYFGIEAKYWHTGIATLIMLGGLMGFFKGRRWMRRARWVAYLIAPAVPAIITYFQSGKELDTALLGGGIFSIVPILGYFAAMNMGRRR